MSDNFQIPQLMYGSAWKEERTEELCFEALSQGFRAIDTANQRKHYFEEGVGRGIARFLKARERSREDLFIQTKFTFTDGQDHRLPYDPHSSIDTQVHQSFESSLLHLGVSYLDSYVLHGPSSHQGIHSKDLEAWQAMEKIYTEGKIRALGISNVSLEQLKLIQTNSKIKPKFVQNRCYAKRKWDKEIRHFCVENNIDYQGFSLLTANAEFLRHPVVIGIAKKYDKIIPQIIFRFAIQSGMIALTGTSNIHHMFKDLQKFDFELDTPQMQQIEDIGQH